MTQVIVVEPRSECDVADVAGLFETRRRSRVTTRTCSRRATTTTIDTAIGRRFLRGGSHVRFVWKSEAYGLHLERPRLAVQGVVV